MCVPKKKDQETTHEEDVQKEACRPSLRKPEYRPELLRAGQSSGQSGSEWYSRLCSKPKTPQTNSQHQQGDEYARRDHGGKQGWVYSMGKKANPRNLDFAKKWSNRRNREGEREKEYPSAKTLSSGPKPNRGEQQARPCRGEGWGGSGVGRR
jgi:hypothetical protein